MVIRVIALALMLFTFLTLTRCGKVDPPARPEVKTGAQASSVGHRGTDISVVNSGPATQASDVEPQK